MGWSSEGRGQGGRQAHRAQVSGGAGRDEQVGPGGVQWFGWCVLGSRCGMYTIRIVSYMEGGCKLREGSGVAGSDLNIPVLML